MLFSTQCLSPISNWKRYYLSKIRTTFCYYLLYPIKSFMGWTYKFLIFSHMYMSSKKSLSRLSTTPSHSIWSWWFWMNHILLYMDKFCSWTLFIMWIRDILSFYKKKGKRTWLCATGQLNIETIALATRINQIVKK